MEHWSCVRSQRDTEVSALNYAFPIVLQVRLVNGEKTSWYFPNDGL